jgi:Zn-dependent protease/CBS domain-containing protein
VGSVEIRVDASVMLIVLLITWNLTVVFHRWHPRWGVLASFAIGLGGAVAYLASILLHELAHAVVARAHGVRVPTITLWMLGGVSSFEEEPTTPSAEFLTAIVGPLTSALLGASFFVLGALDAGPALAVPGDAAATMATRLASLGPLSTLLLWLGPVNLALAVFNMVPAFPLDGGRVLRSVLWALGHELVRATRVATRVGEAIAWTMIATGFAMALGVRVPLLGAGIGAGLWFALLGWFLAGAARRSGIRAVAMELLRGTPVRRVMRRDPRAVPASQSLQTLVDARVLRERADAAPASSREERTFTIVEGDRFVGVVSIGELRRVAVARWSTTRVDEIMTPASATPWLTPDDDAASAFDTMVRADVDRLPVADHEGTLVGVLVRHDVLRWVELHEGAPRATLRPSRPGG